MQPNDARIDTWSPGTHVVLGFLAGTVVRASVEILDASGVRFTSATNAITLELDANPGGGKLYSSYDTTLPAVDGVATFEFTIDQPGSGYTLRASAVGLAGAKSDAFTISDDPAPATTHLRFSMQPNDARIDTWPPALHEELGFAAGTVVHAKVEILDASGARITQATDAITLELDANPGGGTLYSFYGTTLPAVDGVAKFEFTIDKPGAGYTLRASADGLASARSNAFTISE